MNKGRLLAYAFGFLLIALLLMLRGADPYAVRVARETTFDVFQQLKPREAPVGLPIRVLDIDEKSLARFGQWPWPRSQMSEVTQRLTELGAAAIAFDLLFSEPDRLSPSLSSSPATSYDMLFAGALEEAPGVLSLAQSTGAPSSSLPAKFGIAATGDDPLQALPELGGAARPLDILAEAASGLGVASLDRGGAGVARRLPLLWRNGDSVLPTLSLEALRVASAADTLVVLGGSRGDGTVEAVRLGDFVVPTGPTGDLWLYYRPLEDDLFISFDDFMTPDYTDLAPLIEGHIVFIGASASGLLDIRNSTLGEAVPGVSIHVQAIEQMLTGTYLDRADWVGGLEIMLFGLAASVVVIAVVLAGPMVGLLVSAAVAVALVAGSWWAFAGPRLLIDPSFALFGVLVVYAVMAFIRFATADADRRRIRRAFAHYVEPSLLSRIEADASLLRLGGDVRELTVMFSDVRNFSSLAERRSPADLVAMLNRLFAALGSAIIRNHGTIDKFMGDAIMAFWNAPVPVERHALHACRAALAMRYALADLNAGADEPISIGIGIASGPALVGNMGFEQRFDYSCIGDTVNVASRIEGACKEVGFDILVTRHTAAEASEFAFLDAGRIDLKGMTERENVLVLVGDEQMRDAIAFRALSDAHRALLGALSGSGEVAEPLSVCLALAQSVDPRLDQFYRACLDRRDDFRLGEAAQIATVNGVMVEPRPA